MGNVFTEIKWDRVGYAVIVGEWRYWLHRKFPDGKGAAVFGMLNPSVADADRIDPTSRRCIDFARSWNCASVILVNLYASISTDPDELYEKMNATGPRNQEYVEMACRVLRKEGGHFVVAWGNHPLARLQAPTFLKTVRAQGIKPKHLGLTKDGSPRHPLYAPSNAELKFYGR